MLTWIFWNIQDAATSREIPITQIMASSPSEGDSISAGVIGAIVAALGAIVLLGVLVAVYVSRMRKRRSTVRQGGSKSTVGSSTAKAGMPSTMMSNRSFVVRTPLFCAVVRLFHPTAPLRSRGSLCVHSHHACDDVYELVSTGDHGLVLVCVHVSQHA